MSAVLHSQAIVLKAPHPWKMGLFRVSNDTPEKIHLWWSVRESNPRPQQCECCALSAELTPHHLYYTIKISP